MSNVGFGDYRWEFKKHLFTADEVVLCKKRQKGNTHSWSPLRPSESVDAFVAEVLYGIKHEIDLNNQKHVGHTLALVVDNDKYILKKNTGLLSNDISEKDFAKQYLIDFFKRFPTHWTPQGKK